MGEITPQLAYLARPAAEYGAIQFDGSIYEFLTKWMNPAQRRELVALGRRIASDDRAIRRWLAEFPMTEHPESARVYFTMDLLALGNDLGVL